MTIGALLGVAFIVLKVIGQIDWPWWLVVSPIWGECILWVMFLSISTALALLGTILLSRKF